MTPPRRPVRSRRTTRPSVRAARRAALPDRREMAADRRVEFFEKLGDDVAVIGAAPVAVRSNDVEFDYRQDNDFIYLTGFPEPEAVAVFAPRHPEHRFVLFVRPRNPERERWDGPRAGLEGAVADYGADVAFDIAELKQKLPEYLVHGARLHYRLGRNPELDDAVLAAFRQTLMKRNRTDRGPTEIVDLGRTVHDMRLRKRAEELVLLRRAADITAEGHVEAMRATRPGVREYELAALLEYTYRRRGAAGSGYLPIVAAGANATVLHYRAGSTELRKGELLLIDSGAEFDHVSADVTRTFPVSGAFTPAQRRVYELVLDAQLAAIETVRPGRSFSDAHRAAVEVLTRGMVKMNLIEGPVDEAIAEGRFRKYYMHRTGHWLGMDVHDVGSYGEGDARTLEPGMVVTVEPGLYFAPEIEGVPAELAGIGVRIEDDVLVTERGHEVLTAAAPKTVAEMQRARRRR